MIKGGTILFNGGNDYKIRNSDLQALLAAAKRLIKENKKHGS